MTHFRQKVKCFTRSSGNFFIRKVNRKKTKNAKAIVHQKNTVCLAGFEQYNWFIDRAYT